MNETGNGGSAEFRPIWQPAMHGGKEAEVAYNPNAPDNEVVDATTKLSQLYAPAMGAVDPGLYAMLGQFAELQRVERHAEDVVAKAIRFRDDPEGWKTNDRVTPEGKAQTTSWGSDFGRGYFKWLPKRGVQLPILRAFSRRLEVWQAIMRTRLRTIDRYSRRAQTVDDIGWRLVMNEEGATAGEDLANEIRWMSRMLECGGREFNSVKRRELKRQGLVQFHRHMVTDGMTLDQSAVELIGLNGAEGLDSWFVRPSDTFALASPAYKGKLDDGRPIYAYQVLNGKAEIPFGYDELSLWTRNASTWAEENGYGYSEFEQSLETLNNVLQALTFTKSGLSEGAVPKGILMAFGNYDVRTQEAFKAAWSQKVRGIQNQHNLPILFSRGQQGAVQYLNTGQPFDEMAFSKWITLNMVIMGGITGVSPEEVGFESFTADKSTLSGSDTGQKLAAAKDKGLNPLLKDLASFDNDEIVSRCSQRLHMEFCGLDIEQTKERWLEKIKHLTINEVRALFDQPPHPLGWFGNMPADKGEQDAHWQQVQAGFTLGEHRVAMDMPEYPSAMVNASPLNPSLGAIYQQALMVPPEGADGGDGDGQDGGEGEDGQDDPSQPSDLAQRLQRLGEGRTAYEPMGEPEPEKQAAAQE